MNPPAVDDVRRSRALSGNAAGACTSGWVAGSQRVLLTEDPVEQVPPAFRSCSPWYHAYAPPILPSGTAFGAPVPATTDYGGCTLGRHAPPGCAPQDLRPLSWASQNSRTPPAA